MVPFVENPQTHSLQMSTVTFETKRDGARGPLVWFLIVSRDRLLFEFLTGSRQGTDGSCPSPLAMEHFFLGMGQRGPAGPGCSDDLCGLWASPWYGFETWAKFL